MREQIDETRVRRRDPGVARAEDGPKVGALALQQTAGNAAVASLLRSPCGCGGGGGRCSCGDAAKEEDAGPKTVQALLQRDQGRGGLEADPPPDEPIGGLTDVQRDDGAGGATATPAKTTTPSIYEATVIDKTYDPCGKFTWDIGWATTAESGHIVQEITNKYSAKNEDDTPNTTVTPTSKYWEAWDVGADGVVTPAVGDTNDMWRRPANKKTKGSWSMTGRVYWVETLDPDAGFTPRGVRDAGRLKSTTTAPSGLGSVLLSRKAGGTWDCTRGANTHDSA